MSGTGNIAVIPFPVDKLDYAPLKVDYAHDGDALMEIALLTKEGWRQGSDVLHQHQEGRQGDNARWLVHNRVPRGSAPVPDGTFRGGS